jgi:osmotically-inducible protein OsmY
MNSHSSSPPGNFEQAIVPFSARPLPAAPAERHYRLDPADELLETKIHRSLISTGRRSLAQLKVVARGGKVCMIGTVPSYFLKQLAHQAVISIGGIEHLDSQIEVE